MKNKFSMGPFSEDNQQQTNAVFTPNKQFISRNILLLLSVICG